VFLPRASTVFLAALMLATFAASPAWAATNQLFMTGTGSGNTPVIYTNGVDSNINMALMLKGTGGVGIDNTSPGALLDVGLAGTTTGTLRLEGITSGYVQVQPSAAAGSWTMTLPTGVPASNGYVLSSTTAGVTSWVANGSSVALSSVTSATGVNTIDSTNNAQTWEWGTLTTGTALTLTTSSMTGGTLLSLQDTAAAATSTGYVLSVTDATTGTGYGIYSAITGHGNTGYAGYFTNTDTSTNANYALYVSTSSGNAANALYVETASNCCGPLATFQTTGFTEININSGYQYPAYFAFDSLGCCGYIMAFDAGASGALDFINVTNINAAPDIRFGNDGTVQLSSAGTVSEQTGYELTVGGGSYSTQTINSYAGVAGLNSSTSGSGYGGYFSAATTGAGYGTYSVMNGLANTGYAGYFTNTATTANYGVYATAASTGTGGRPT
jgi:hypothetical protein